MFGSKFKFDSTLTMKTHAYAYFLNDGWHRGIAAHINFNDVQVSGLKTKDILVILIYKMFY